MAVHAIEKGTAVPRHACIAFRQLAISVDRTRCWKNSLWKKIDLFNRKVWLLGEFSFFFVQIVIQTSSYFYT